MTMEGTSALQLVPDHQAAIFDTSKPDLVIDKAQGIAKKLTDIVEKAHLFSMISNRKYVKVEGWTTMLAMLGVFPHVEYCRLFDDTNRTDMGYEARVVLKTIDGKAVGSGEAMCSNAERNWQGRDEFAIKSMAQTRATGKAARNAFSWIMALAGYEATPAEEMSHDEPRPTQKAAQIETARQTEPQEATDGNGDFLTSRFSVSDPVKARSGTTFWRVLDAKQGRYQIWDSAVVRDLQAAGSGDVTVELKTDDKGYTKIVRVVNDSQPPVHFPEHLAGVNDPD